MIEAKPIIIVELDTHFTVTEAKKFKREILKSVNNEYHVLMCIGEFNIKVLNGQEPKKLEDFIKK